MADQDNYVPRLKSVYESEIKQALMKEFGYTNVMQVPKLSKIVLNMGVGEAVADSKKLTSAVEELTLIAGQRAIKTHARKSIASFKIREGQAIGTKVTLRGARMFEFLDRLINVALPRVRDFRGVSGKAFDGRGNYSMGVKEHIVFPEINYDKVEQIRGFNVVICTTAASDQEASALLKGFNFPFGAK